MLDILVGATGIIILSSLYTCNIILFSLLNLDIYCFSALMASKLFEMDEVVKTIHINTLQNLEDDQRKTLLVCDNPFVAWIVYYRIDDLFIVVGAFQDININRVWDGGNIDERNIQCSSVNTLTN